MFDEIVKILDAVRRVPDLKRYLISLSTLDLKSYKYISKCVVLNVSKDAHIVMTRWRRSQLYILHRSKMFEDQLPNLGIQVDFEFGLVS